MDLAVDVVIAIHDASRPLQRALASLADAGLPDDAVRTTVVCHGVAKEDVQRGVDEAMRSRVRWLHTDDGRGPGMPFGVGIAAAEAEYVSIMGSDDWLEPGALAGWLDFARANRLDAVIPRERHASGALVRTPPVRSWPLHRRVRLDPLRDRLVYRTAPLGLVRRAAIREDGLEFDPDLLIPDKSLSFNIG